MCYFKMYFKERRYDKLSVYMVHVSIFLETVFQTSRWGSFYQGWFEHFQLFTE